MASTLVSFTPTAGRPCRRAGFAISAEEMRKQLDLNVQQVRQLDSILDDFGRYYDNLMADGQTRIRQILNDDQRRKFDRLIAERRSR